MPLPPTVPVELEDDLAIDLSDLFAEWDSDEGVTSGSDPAFWDALADDNEGAGRSCPDGFRLLPAKHADGSQAQDDCEEID